MRNNIIYIFDRFTLRKLGSFTFFSALNKFLWGFWLLNPKWDTFSASVGYHYVRVIAREYVWGIVLLSAGLFHLIAYYKENYTLLMCARTISLLLWSFITIMIGLSNPIGTGLINYGSIVFVEMFIIVFRGGSQP